jgi:hypothetical protein
MAQNLVQRYLEEPTDIMAEDGHIMNRGEVINQMTAEGFEYKDIDRFLFRVDQRMSRERSTQANTETNS